LNEKIYIWYFKGSGFVVGVNDGIKTAADRQWEKERIAAGLPFTESYQPVMRCFGSAEEAESNKAAIMKQYAVAEEDEDVLILLRLVEEKEFDKRTARRKKVGDSKPERPAEGITSGDRQTA
jgi:hypothetical protein